MSLWEYRPNSPLVEVMLKATELVTVHGDCRIYFCIHIRDSQETQANTSMHQQILKSLSAKVQIYNVWGFIYWTVGSLNTRCISTCSKCPHVTEQFICFSNVPTLWQKDFIVYLHSVLWLTSVCSFGPNILYQCTVSTMHLVRCLWTNNNLTLDMKVSFVFLIIKGPDKTLIGWKVCPCLCSGNVIQFRRHIQYANVK